MSSVSAAYIGGVFREFSRHWICIYIYTYKVCLEGIHHFWRTPPMLVLEVDELGGEYILALDEDEQRTDSNPRCEVQR